MFMFQASRISAIAPRVSLALLWYAQDQLAEEIASGHDLVRLGGVGQVERSPHHAMQTAVARHMHHRGEAAPAAGAAAHQRQRTALQNGQIERDLAPCRRPGDDQPATGLEARETLIPHRCADTVEHHVHAAAVGELLDALAELRRGRVVDHLVSAELFGFLELPVTSRRDDGAGTDALGHEEAEASHAAADRLDQDVFPRLELYALDETVPGRVPREGERRRLLESHPVGDPLQIGRGDLAVLRVTAVELAAQPLLALAELVAPLHTRRASAALDAILYHDPVALFPPGHASSQTRDFSGDIEPQDARQPTGRRAARADREVGVIDGRPPDADDDLAGSRLGVGAVTEDQLLPPSRVGDIDGLHLKIAWHLGALKIQVSTQSTSSIL